MEIAKTEIAALEQATAKAADPVQLSELELALVGGGVGDILLG